MVTHVGYFSNSEPNSGCMYNKNLNYQRNGTTVKNPDTFIEETIGDPQTLDPAAAYDTTSSSYIELVYNTLVNYHQTSTTQFDPGLADKWTVSADGKTYRFHIRQGVKFSNGDVLTPDDVKYSFERGMVQDYSGGPQWLVFFPLFGVNSSRDSNGNLMPLSQLKVRSQLMVNMYNSI